MNKQEKDALTEKVRRSKDPYQALFGQERTFAGKGKRKRQNKRHPLPPMNVLPALKDRQKLNQKVAGRAMHILKHLDLDLYWDIYDAEMKIEVDRLMENTPNPDLVRKYNRNLVPGKRAD